MSTSDWYAQGVMLGSMTTIKDWNETMNAATNDPGTVQIHIQRSLDKAAAEKAKPINAKENCKPCNFVAKLEPLYQFTINGGWSVL